MKIQDAIEQARALRDTDVSDDQLVKWLSDLDGQLCEDVCAQYGTTPEDWETVWPYWSYATDKTKELLVGAPWDGMYVDYLVMRIDLQHADYERCNNGAMLFASRRQEWANWMTREHVWRRKPKPPDTPTLFGTVLRF